MSKHAKKLQRAEDWAGGSLPVIDVDEANGDAWLFWDYRVAPFTVRVEIPLMGPDDSSPWLYVDGNDSPLDDEETCTRAEAQYGAMTRVRLLEGHADEIRQNATTGLVRLREVATVAGLFGKREPRRCVTPTWTTQVDRLGLTTTTATQ